jgi:hypothetical protein
VSTIQHGGGVTESWAADRNGMARPRRISATDSTGATVWSTGTYLYDRAGNIKQIGATTYVYDVFNRLASWTSGPLTGSYSWAGNGYDTFEGKRGRVFASRSSDGRVLESIGWPKRRFRELSTGCRGHRRRARTEDPAPSVAYSSYNPHFGQLIDSKTLSSLDRETKTRPLALDPARAVRVSANRLILRLFPHLTEKRRPDPSPFAQSRAALDPRVPFGTEHD